MSLPPRYLSQKLTEALPTKDGGTLHTVGQAIDYMVRLSKEREMRAGWQNACKLILARAAVADITKALSLALFLDAKLDVSAKTVRTRKTK